MSKSILQLFTLVITRQFNAYLSMYESHLHILRFLVGEVATCGGRAIAFNASW